MCNNESFKGEKNQFIETEYQRSCYQSWYTLIAPILYRTIVTYDLSLLFVGLSNPPIADILSKRELFGITRALFLEYDPKPIECQDFTVDELEEYMYMYQNGNLNVGDINHARKVVTCLREMETIKDSWRPISQPDEHQSYPWTLHTTIFPNLSSVAVGALFEQAQDRWSCADKMDDYDDLRHQGQECLSNFLDAHQSVSSICCTREGPISLPSSLIPTRSEATMVSLHSTRGSLEGLKEDSEVSWGTSIRWYIHSWPVTGLDDDGAVFDMHGDFAFRWAHMTPHPVSAAADLDWGLYLGPREDAETLGKSDQTRIVEEEICKLKDELRKGEAEETTVYHTDFGPIKWEIEKLASAPRCAACTWSPSPA